MEDQSIVSSLARLIRQRGLSEREIAQIIHALMDVGYRLVPKMDETGINEEDSQLTATMDSVDEDLIRMFQDEYDADDVSITRGEQILELGDGDEPGQRFEFIREFARGGVGSISLVKDQELRRTIVMKTLIDGKGASDYVRNKFVEEAQITAQLEHPNIVPVHEFGRLAEGEMFFTMKLVQGRTLKDVLRQLRSNDSKTEIEFGRTRLIGMFVNVCQAVAFAHSRNVIHRDIKPANIMVGEYGEVLLLDWGVAKVLGTEDLLEATEQVVQTARSASGDATMMGLITGTPSYMPPEQAAGRIDKLDPRSDVYALGAVLYEILTLKRPFHEKTHKETLKAVITAPVKAPTDITPDRNIPTALEEICLKSLAKRPRDRYPTVTDMLGALMTYLAGVEDRDRRERQSDERLEDGLAKVANYHEVRASTLACRDQLLDLEWDTPPHGTNDQKNRLWTMHKKLRELEVSMNQSFENAAKVLVESIGFNPSNNEACNELARLYWYALNDAEQEGDREASIRYRSLVASYDRGLYTDQLKGEGRINVRSFPTKAVVSASRYVEDSRKLVSEGTIELGTTPLSAHVLPEGSWMLTLKSPGYRDLRQPLMVRRAEVSDLNCQLYIDDEVGPHYLQIPEGRFIMGGDPACESARLRRIETLDDFFIARYPVTCAEYLAFLRDLDKTDPDDALRRVPRTRAEGGQLWGRADGRFVWPQIDRHGFRWAAHWPVFGISFDDAETYAKWYSQRTGTAVRLPTELEWEKAARGTDGRWYPWGEFFDETFCRMARSESGSPMPVRVGSYPSDCSPFGVFDMAGLVREYCNSAFDADENLRVVRGGSYATQGGVSCRVTNRQAVLRHVPSLDQGFRLVRNPDSSTPGRGKLVRPQL